MATRFQPALAVFTATVALGWSVATATGGEPIRFSGDKSKPAPNAPNKLPQERLSTLDRLPVTTPFDAISSQGMSPGSRRMDPKQEKRIKNAKLEEKNWVLLDRGELQDQDDEETSFGVRDYSGDSLEKEGDRTGEIWFGSNQDRSGKSDRASRPPAASGRSPNPARPQSAPRAVENNIRFQPEKGSSAEVGPVNSQNQAKEGGFQNLAPEADANHTLKELFGLGPTTARSPMEPERGRDGFGLRSINMQPGSASPGLGRGFGLGTELVRPSAAPSPSMIEGPRSQPRSLPAGGLGSSRLSSSFDSPKFDLNTGARSSVTPLSQPRNDYAPASTRDMFAPPTRPGQSGVR